MSERSSPPTSGTDGNERVGTDERGRPVGWGRRDLLRLTGAAVVGVAGLPLSRRGVASGRVTGTAAYREIVVPPGGTYHRRVGDGDSFSDTLIDISARGASTDIVAYGSGWEIRNVGFRGFCTSTDKDNLINASVTPGGSGVIENVYFGDGAVSGGHTPIFVPTRHAGVMDISRVHTQGWPDNAIYASAPGRFEKGGKGGIVRIERCFSKNNNISNFRLGTDGSYVRDSVIHVDGGVPKWVNGHGRGRGVWVKEGGTVDIVNCQILLEDSDGSYCIWEGDDNSQGLARITDSEVEARSGAAGRFHGRVRTSNVGRSPDVTPPAGVPMSAEAAASGESVGSKRRTLAIVGNSGAANYEFAVSGDLIATPSINPSDVIDGPVAAGSVNGGTDSYEFTGDVEYLRYDAPIGLRIDGEAVDPASLATLPDTVTIEGLGDQGSQYTLSVSGRLGKSLANGASVNPQDEVAADRRSASGFVKSGVDSYAFSGEITDMSGDLGSLTVSVNGREVDPTTFGELPRVISIVGDPGVRVAYDLTVTGEIEKSTDRGATIDDGDTITGSSASGEVNGGTDSYRFSGEIADLAIDASRATVYVDGTEVDPGQFERLDGRIVVDGSAYEESARYEITVSDRIEVLESPAGDNAEGGRAWGAVGGYKDGYAFSGEITDFRHEGPLDLYVDGEQVDPSAFRDLPRSIAITGQVNEEIPYELSVSGELAKSTDMGGSINPQDQIAADRTSATGFVKTGTDTYRFAGEVSALDVDPRKVRVSVDGEEVDPIAFSTLPREIRISNEGFDDPATYAFSVSDELGATRSVEGSDAVSESSTEGTVEGDVDVYRFDGEVVEFSHDGPLRVFVDGSEVDLGTSRETLRISGEGLPGVFDYAFSVSGDLEGRNLNSDDSPAESSSEGYVSSGYDEYRFGGDLTGLRLGHENGLAVSVDGESGRVRIDGPTDGAEVSYELAVSGDLRGANTNADDSISGGRATGYVSVGYDEYAFTGDFESIAFAGVTVLDIRR